MRRPLSIAMLVVVGLIAVGCNRGDDGSTTTTSFSAAVETGGDTTSTTAGSTTTVAPADSSTVATTTAVVVGMPTYEVVGESSSNGAPTLVVVVEPDSFSNVELQNLVFDIVDRFAPTTAIVVDVKEAADLLFQDELTPEEDAFLSEHILIQITNGVEVTFLGPYSDVPGLMIGS